LPSSSWRLPQERQRLITARKTLVQADNCDRRWPISSSKVSASAVGGRSSPANVINSWAELNDGTMVAHCCTGPVSNCPTTVQIKGPFK
jgi:hypothetical protein